MSISNLYVSSFQTLLPLVLQADCHAVTTHGRENWCPTIKCNRLFPLDKSHKFQNFYKVNTYSKTTKYRSHSYTLRS